MSPLAESPEMIQTERIFLSNAFSPERFGRWLLQQDPGGEIGYVRDPFGCPIARWLESIGVTDPEVNPDTISFFSHGVPYSSPTPTWVKAFICGVDDLAAVGEWIMSAHRAHEVLRSVLSAPRTI